jgi:hypothetical protein
MEIKEPTISFFNCVSTKKKATEESLKNLREIYPEAYIMLVCDACESYMDLCETYNCEYLHSNIKCGYPTQPYGYSMENVLEWMSRFYIAALRCKSDYIMMFEDDILLTKKITIDPNWEVAGPYVDESTLKPDSRLPKQLLDFCYLFSGKYPNVDYYAAGGGAIFKVSTFIEYYPQIVKFFNTSGRILQNHVYPTLGWIDCFMTIFYFLAGKDWSYNTKLTSLYNVTDWDRAVNELKDEFEIIAHYKKYY